MRNYVSKKWYKSRDHRKFTYPKDVDKELVPMLDVFNNIPGVRTVYSCCGHGYPGWYMMFYTASDYMANVLEDYFRTKGMGKLDSSLEFQVERCDEGWKDWNPVPENRITIYCDNLGMMKTEARRKEYAKVCEFFSQYAPRREWEKVHEF